LRADRWLWLALCLPAPAFGWEPSGVHWRWQDHAIEDYFYLNYSSFPSDVGDAYQTRDAMLYAMSAWNALGDDAALVYGGSTGLATNAADGTFVLFWADTYMSGGTLAYAGAWSWADGAAYDCDIVFLSRNDYGSVTWSSNPAGPSGGRYDVQAVALHELGHCLGLGHSTRSDAVMNAYYAGLRSLSSDEVDAIAALYGAPCVDGDGDGWSDCAKDCDDANALVFPGAAEVCDGADGNCDGVIDSDVATEYTLIDPDKSRSSDTGWASVGNVVRVDTDTSLVSSRVHMSAPVGTRLVWSIYSATAAAGPYTLERTDVSYAVAGEWQSSPVVHFPMAAGRWYEIALGALSPTQSIWFEARPSRTPHGPVTPVGYTRGRALGDAFTAPSADYLLDQVLSLVDPADADGDGVTTVCGDCDDADPNRAVPRAETCDGTDEDCDGAVDEDFASDADGDGVYDCRDACPNGADRDGDGVCDDVDVCPDDAADACDDEAVETGAPDTDVGPSIQPGRCSCASSSGSLPAVALIAAAALLLRRRVR
jgi:hypothetical protein